MARSDIEAIGSISDSESLYYIIEVEKRLSLPHHNKTS